MKYNIRAMMKNSKEIFGENAQLEAVKQDGNNIQYIHNPSETIQLEAVKQNKWAIRLIHNPSEFVQLEAVKQNGEAIRFIHNPSEAVMQAALNQNETVIKYFKQAWLKNLSEVHMEMSWGMLIHGMPQYTHMYDNVCDECSKIRVKRINKILDNLGRKD